MKKLIILTTLALLTTNVFSKGKTLDCYTYALNGSPELERFVFHAEKDCLNKECYNGQIQLIGLDVDYADKNQVIIDDGNIFHTFKGNIFEFNYEGEYWGRIVTFDNGVSYEGRVAVEEDFSYFIECTVK